MFSNTVDRVAIKSDEDWQTFFIPWLEHQEENNVGVDDGVFVVIAVWCHNLNCTNFMIRPISKRILLSCSFDINPNLPCCRQL